MATARKSTTRGPATARGADVTKALDALNDATTRAQTAAKAIRADLGRSPLRADLVRNVERLARDLHRDASKLDRAVRSDVRKAISAKKPAAKKSAVKKPAVKKAAAKKTTAARRSGSRAA